MAVKTQWNEREGEYLLLLYVYNMCLDNALFPQTDTDNLVLIKMLMLKFQKYQLIKSRILYLYNPKIVEKNPFMNINFTFISSE